MTSPAPTCWPWSFSATVASGFIVTLVSATLALVFPLATYTVSLAFFGLAHVLSELRYVDLRFSSRVLPPLRLRLGLLLGGVVLLRSLSNLKILSSSLEVPLELAVVALLCVSLWPLLEEGRGAALVLAAMVVGGIWVDPLTTLLTLSVLHNLTPLGFLAEGAPAPQRRWVMAGAVLMFVGVPLLISTGWIQGWLEGYQIGVSLADPLGAGGLDKHRYVFVPPPIANMPWANHFFAGVVCAQCLHYFVVIHVLPRILPPSWDEVPPTVVAWPSHFSRLVVLASGLMVPLFFWHFGNARAFYGLAAAVHAWVELPVLLLALDGALRGHSGRLVSDPVRN